MHCLVVEDDLELAEVWRIALDDSAVDACVVENFVDAENALLTETFDLVITDLALPDGDGTGIAQLVALRQPETPVVIVTGSCKFERGELFGLCPNVAGVFRKSQDLDEVVAYVEHLARTMPQATAH